MAADLTGSGEGSEPTAATAPATSAAPRPVPMQPILLAPRANRLRFTLIYVFLGIVVVGAIVALGIFATRSINPAPKWSAWKPTGGGQGAAHQIADHVARQYRLPNGDQLVDVISKAPSITPSTSTLPVHFVAVRGAKGAADQVYPVSSTNSVMYSLCGLGTSCEIASGKPSIERADFRSTPDATRDSEARAWVRALAKRPYDLTAEFPFRVGLARIANDDYRQHGGVVRNIV